MSSLGPAMVQLWSSSGPSRSGPAQLKFNSLELDREVGRLVLNCNYSITQKLLTVVDSQLQEKSIYFEVLASEKKCRDSFLNHPCILFYYYKERHRRPFHCKRGFCIGMRHMVPRYGVLCMFDDSCRGPRPPRLDIQDGRHRRVQGGRTSQTGHT